MGLSQPVRQKWVYRLGLTAMWLIHLGSVWLAMNVVQAVCGIVAKGFETF